MCIRDRVVNNERLELTLKEGVTYSDGAKVKDATKVYACPVSYTHLDVYKRQCLCRVS